MKFNVGENLYVIEFEREYRQVLMGVDVSVDSEKNEVRTPKYAQSQHPYTTVRLIQVPKQIEGVVPGSKIVYRTATVGCWHKEKTFNHEKGRIHALRTVGETVSKDFRKAMWKAYSERNYTNASE